MHRAIRQLLMNKEYPVVHNMDLERNEFQERFESTLDQNYSAFILEVGDCWHLCSTWDELKEKLKELDGRVFDILFVPKTEADELASSLRSR